MSTSPNNSLDDENMCPICLDTMCELDNTCITSCNHKFHTMCLTKVRTKNCPLCRESIVKKLVIFNTFLSLKCPSCDDYLDTNGKDVCTMCCGHKSHTSCYMSLIDTNALFSCTKCNKKPFWTLRNINTLLSPVTYVFQIIIYTWYLFVWLLLCVHRFTALAYNMILTIGWTILKKLFLFWLVFQVFNIGYWIYTLYKFYNNPQNDLFK